MKITTQWTFTKEEAEKEIEEWFDAWDGNPPIPQNWHELSLTEKIYWMWRYGCFDGVEFDRYTNCYTTLEKIIVEGE